MVLAPDIIKKIDQASKAGRLAKFLTHPDPAWKTQGDTSLQHDFYKTLKHILPTLDPAGLTRAKESALSNPSLAKMVHECGMEDLARTWCKQVPSAHSDLEGKEADALEAFYFYCKEESDELRFVANLVVNLLVCKRIKELMDDAADVSTEDTLAEEGNLLPEWVVEASAENLNMSFQKAWAKSDHKDKELEVKCIQGGSDDKPEWETTVWLGSLTDGPKKRSNVKKSKAILLAKVSWLQRHDPRCYEEHFLKELRA